MHMQVSPRYSEVIPEYENATLAGGARNIIKPKNVKDNRLERQLLMIPAIAMNIVRETGILETNLVV